MLTNRSNMAEVLKTLHLSREEPKDCTFDCYQEILAKSLLVEKMHAMRDSIHAGAGQNLLYEEVLPNLTKAYVDTFLKGAASTTICH